MKKGRAGTMTHDYKRHGTTTLFAALNILDGTVIGQNMQRHRHQEFTNFNEREKGFEAKFKHEEELRFKVVARRNRLLGLWAAGRGEENSRITHGPRGRGGGGLRQGRRAVRFRGGGG